MENDGFWKKLDSSLGGRYRVGYGHVGTFKSVTHTGRKQYGALTQKS